MPFPQSTSQVWNFLNKFPFSKTHARRLATASSSLRVKTKYPTYMAMAEQRRLRLLINSWRSRTSSCFSPLNSASTLLPQKIASSSALSNYLASLTQEDDAAPSESDLTYVDLYPVGVQIVMPSGRVLLPNPLRLAAWYECGSIVRPRPRRAMPAVLVGEVADPAATLSSWGYHRTPGFAGGGWTRPQTYNPARCGISTYRDHAFVGLRFTSCIGTACEFRWPIREQNYVAAPYGEPNPEVWRSGPWPYATWPAYVYWWHATR